MTSLNASDPAECTHDQPTLLRMTSKFVTSGLANLSMTPPSLVSHETGIDGLAVRAVSFRGTAHALFGEPRQDAFAISESDEWVCVAVADGIGSCEYSHIGSANAAMVAAALGSGALSPQEALPIMEFATDVCESTPVPEGFDSSTFSTTLTVALIEKAAQADGSRHVLVHAVGDSPALLLETDTSLWHYLTPSDDGPSNVVRSWIPGHYDSYFSAGAVLPAGAVLVLCSDGFSVPLGDGTGPLGQDLARRWTPGPRDLVPYVVDLSFNAYHDDKTVVAVWSPRTEAPAADEERTASSE
jgi:serine/threonine protein phosphatase PrpC